MVLIAFQQTQEVLHIYFTNKSHNAMNQYIYTLYFLVPVYAFLTVTASRFIKVPKLKAKYMTFSYLGLAFIVFGMMSVYSSELLWRFLLSPSIKPRVDIIPPEMLNSAIRAATFYFPVVVVWALSDLFAFFMGQRECAPGIIDLNFSFFPPTPIEPVGPLTCEVTICIDAKVNKPIVVPENRRMEATLIQGATGTGKTSTLLLPMGAIDIERKYFFRELSKELGFKALEKGYAYIEAPLSNEELNKHFSLNLIKPLKGKEALFEKEIDDMIKYKDSKTGEILYRDLGIGAIDPDGEYVKNFREITKNFGIDCIIVDPLHEDSIGINPFIEHDPAKVAMIISTVLKGMYESENPGDNNVFFGQVTQQALENLSILLKVMYPRLHDGLLPTLEDMLQILYNYEIAEELCEELKKDPVLAQEYRILIGYFEKNFYKPHLNERGFPIPGSVGSGRKVTEQFLYGATTQLDNILRQGDVKRVLCSRSNNIDFDDIFKKGKCFTVCTRRGPMGSLLSKAFGMFFILTFQDSALRRPGSEKTRKPFFLYIDEFPDFVNKETETCFTLFRKYRVAMIVAIQNLSQLERSTSMAFYKKVLLANTKTQLVFGDTNVEDSEYWSEAFGDELAWTSSNSPDGSTTQAWGYEPFYKPTAINYQAFKALKYKTKNPSGKTIFGSGKTNFVAAKYYEQHPVKFYNFDKFKIYAPYSEPDRDPAPQYDSISTSFSQVDSDVKSVSIPSPVSAVTPNITHKPELDIALGSNIKADIKNDKISTEEMNALKELITEIHSDDSSIEFEEPTIEIATSLSGIQPFVEIVDSEPVERTSPLLDFKRVEAPEPELIIQADEDDKQEKLDLLDKTGKIKIEVNQN